jgi:hypothetical protein
VISSEDLRILAAEREATLHREAAVARMVRREGARRSVRFVQPLSLRMAIVAASVIALTGTLRVEH